MSSTFGETPFRSLLKSVSVLLGCWLFFRVSIKIKRAFQVRRLAAAQGCATPVRWTTKDPIFGLDALWTIYKDYNAHKFLQATVNRFQKFQSHTLYYSTLWGVPTVSTIEPENLKTVLSTKFDDYKIDEGKKSALQSITGPGIFSTDGEQWQHSRNLLKPIFFRAKIDDPAFLEPHADDLVELIKSESDKVIDLQPLFGSVSLDVMTDFLFGESARSLHPENRKSSDGSKTEAEQFFDAFSYIVRCANGMTSEWGILGLFLPDPGMKKNKKFMDDYVTKVIDNAIAADKDSKDDSNARETFLSVIVKSSQDRPRLCSEFLNILLAGRDTIESFLSSLFFTLSQRPDIFNKLQKEIDSSGIPMNPSIAQLNSLAYLRGCLNEAQRLYPSAPENDRQANKDTLLPVGGGPDGTSPIFVKEGTMVHYSNFALHRRKDIWGEDAEEFKPERWMDGPDGKQAMKVGWHYLPFSKGPRVCVGQQFALMETGYLTVRLVREFEKIEAVEKGPWIEQPTIVATVFGGVKVRVTPRK